MQVNNLQWARLGSSVTLPEVWLILAGLTDALLTAGWEASALLYMATHSPEG